MSAKQIVDIAQAMIAKHGNKAAVIMQERAEHYRQAGDRESAVLWAQVAKAVRALLDEGRPKPRQTMPLAPFRPAFEATPHPYLLLLPDLRIAGANDRYLKVTMTQRTEIVGRGLFEVFPDNPDNPNADGVSKLGASLARVLDGGRTDGMALRRYDIRRPDGVFEERWWQSFTVPVVDEGRLVAILHHVVDVTGTQCQLNG